MKLFIEESIYKDQNISVYGLSVYCALKTLIITEENKNIYVTTELLAYQLTRSIHCQRRFLDYIRTGLNELIDLQIIKKTDEKSKHYVFDCSKLFIDTEKQHFTIIESEELLTIFRIKTANNFMLLKYFIYLMGTISSSIDVWLDAYDHRNRVIGNLTIDRISHISNTPERTIIEYNKLLEENNLLYVHRAEDFIIDKSNGSITRFKNIYGRPVDKIYIDAFAAQQKKYKQSYIYKENTIEDANRKRSYAQKYNWLCKGYDKKYSLEQIRDIYEYVLTENLKYERLYEKQNNSYYLDKIRSLNVFEKYGFKKEVKDK